MDRIRAEWVENEWVVVADRDPARFSELAESLESIGFARERVAHADSSDALLNLLAERNAAIVVLDDSVGAPAFREAHARLHRAFGPLGFFLFAVTEGSTPDFVQFAAEARVDGVIFRPYRTDEFRRRLAEVFSVKWPNRVVETSEGREEFLVRGKGDAETFARASEKETRLGRRDPLTPDTKISSLTGLHQVSHPAVKPGRGSFTKVRLAFKAVARNGDALEKPFPIHALEVDENEATFECAHDVWEPGDHVTIEADIAHGEESYFMRIEGIARDGTEPGFLRVTFDKGNRTRFEAAMKMVAKRFNELKDFFKYAKGA
jgi:DNA-binding NarL/FixJ family response regulator